MGYKQSSILYSFVDTSLYLQSELRYTRIIIFPAAILAAILEIKQVFILILFIFELYDLHFTAFVFVSKSRVEITWIRIFGGHLGRHFEKYATFVIDFYIFELYVLHFIYVNTSFVLLSESRTEEH